MRPGKGIDVAVGGRGDDGFYPRADGEVDQIRCGPGNDGVAYLRGVDPKDVLFNCETVYQPQVGRG